MSKEIKLGDKFEDNYFEYELIEESKYHNIIGWRIRAKSNVKKFRCNSTYKGYPIISLRGAFSSLNKTDNIDISEMDVSNVIVMFEAFQFCEHLKLLDISTWNMNNVQDMRCMFSNCRRLETLIFPKDAVLKECSTDLMFYNCFTLKKIDMSGITIKNVVKSSRMFDGCRRVEYIDIRNLSFNEAYIVEELHPLDYNEIATMFVRTNSLICIISANKAVAVTMSVVLGISEDIIRDEIMVKGIKNFNEEKYNILINKLRLMNCTNTCICAYNIEE